jgi:hypothetical protein
MDLLDRISSFIQKNQPSTISKPGDAPSWKEGAFEASDAMMQPCGTCHTWGEHCDKCDKPHPDDTLDKPTTKPVSVTAVNIRLRPKSIKKESQGNLPQVSRKHGYYESKDLKVHPDDKSLYGGWVGRMKAQQKKVPPSGRAIQFGTPPSGLMGKSLILQKIFVLKEKIKKEKTN